MSTILSKNGTAFSTNGDNQYIELQDQGNAVQVVPVKQSPPERARWRSGTPKRDQS